MCFLDVPESNVEKEWTPQLPCLLCGRPTAPLLAPFAAAEGASGFVSRIAGTMKSFCRMRSKGLGELCPTKVSHKCVLQERPTRVSLQEGPLRRVLDKSVKQKCCTSVPPQNVFQECLLKGPFRKGVNQRLLFVFISCVNSGSLAPACSVLTLTDCVILLASLAMLVALPLVSLSYEPCAWEDCPFDSQDMLLHR